MSYTRNEVQEIIKIHSLYQMDCVNWTGKTKKSKTDGGGEYYTEVIAERVLENPQILNIPHGTVRESFAFPEHDGNTKRADSPRKEERFCLDRYQSRNHEITPFGKVINYQVNIFKGTKINVDLVAYDDSNDILWLIEVKGHNGESAETLLRCVLEIETYYECLLPHKQTLLTTLRSKDESVITTEKTEIRKGIWVPQKSKAAKEYSELNNRPYLAKLIERYNIKIETYR